MATHYLQDIRTGAMLGVLTGAGGTILTPAITAALEYVGLPVPELLYLGTVGGSFGLGLGALMRWKFNMALWKVALLTFLTPLLYYCGLSTAIIAHDLFGTGGSLIVSGLAGGAIGAGLLALLLVLLMAVPRGLTLIGLVTAAGAIIGGAMLPFMNVKSEFLEMLVLHVPWHMGVMAVLFAGLGARLRASDF